MEAGIAAEQLRAGFVLGPWKVQPNQNLIDDGQNSIHLEPKVMEVLCFLAQRQDEVVSRDELLAEVWKGTFVTDEVLSRAISVLRSQLGDDRKNASYVVTVPKSGYRLIMPATPQQAKENQPALPDTGGRTPLPLFRIGLLAVGLVVLAVVALSYMQPASDSITDIAVLPFQDLSDQPGNAFFSDGLTDEILGSLSKVQGLHVVARSSSLSFRNRHEDVRRIGEILKVQAVVEGTVKRVGNRIRVSSLLSSTEDGYVLWSETYDRELDDLLILQDEISTSIVSALQEKLGLSDLLATEVNITQPDMAAYQLYLNARFLGKLRGAAPLRESIALYERALELDPEFTRASLGLANSTVLLPSYTNEDQEEMFAKALKMLAQLNFASAEETGEAEAIKGFIALQRWQWIDAEAYFRKALVLAPSNPNLYVWYSQFLSTVGRTQDALKAALQARELDAVSPVVNDLLAVAYLWAGDNERAAEQFAIGAERGFNTLRNPGYLIFLLREQRFAQAREVIKNYYAASQSDPRWLIDNIQAIRSYDGDDDLIAAAEKAVAAGHVIPRFQMGLWLYLQQPEKVFQTMHHFRDQKENLDFVQLFTEEGNHFRDSDEFSDLVKETDLDTYWEHHGGPDAHW